MRVVPIVIPWASKLDPVDDPATDLMRGPTPAPSLGALVALVGRVQAACTAPYAMTGVSTRLRIGTGDTSTSTWAVYQQVNVGTQAMRAKVARCGDGATSQARDTHIEAPSSGGSGVNEIVIPSPLDHGEDTWPADSGQVVIASGSSAFDASPEAAGDRLLESPTVASLAAPVAELIKIRGGVGCTFVPVQVADLNAI